jgi:hypothetical protein
LVVFAGAQFMTPLARIETKRLSLRFQTPFRRLVRRIESSKNPALALNNSEANHNRDCPVMFSPSLFQTLLPFGLVVLVPD